MKMVKNDDRPLKIINAQENISAAIIRLQAFENRFLYVVKYCYLPLFLTTWDLQSYKQFKNGFYENSINIPIERVYIYKNV